MPFAPRIAFVDVETTGMSPASCRITEIGVVSVEHTEAGWQTREWHSLVNPGVPIPPEIRFLTGITDAAVAGAPAFAELAPGLLDLLDGAVFVAHQARFDYGFLKAELARAGHAFSARTLCTVRLSRLMDPDRTPHSLDAIIARHGLDVPDRHRALGDARALWLFVQSLARRQGEAALRRAALQLLQHPGLPAHLNPEALAELPQGHGVYAMLGANGQPLYVGRSSNLRRRVASHFSTDPTRERAVRLASETHRLEWRQTAGELGARLLEGQWIQTRRPSHNIAQRQTQPVFIELPADQPPRIVALHAVAPQACAGLFGPFASRAGARAVLLAAATTAGLCLSTLGLERRAAGQPCFRRQLGRCAGACVGVHPPPLDFAKLRAQLATHEMPAWPYAGAIALVEPTATTADWHVFWQWRHLGSVHDAAAADALAQVNTRFAHDDTPPTGAICPRLDPAVYRLLRQRVAPDAGQAIVLL